jgi:hypothetical protein
MSEIRPVTRPENATRSGSGATSGIAVTNGAAPSATPKKKLDVYEVMKEDVQVNMGLPTIMKVITLSGPYFIVLLFIMISIINSNIKGFIYFFGLIILYLIVGAFQLTIPNNKVKDRQVICSLMDKYIKIHPSFISGLYAYTITFI